MLFLLAITLLAVTIPAESATNYCALCTNHIACNNTGVMACNGTVDSFSSADIKLFLDQHNILRNKIASGGQAGFPTAAKMATMVNITVEQWA